jgi:hypothetical protein
MGLERVQALLRIHFEVSQLEGPLHSPAAPGSGTRAPLTR